MSLDTLERNVVYSENRRILVTGSSGFIGSKLVQKLLSMEHEVIGLDIVRSICDDENFKHFSVDFTDKNELLSLFDLVKPDVCYHVGAIADLNFARKHPAKTVEVNVMGTANLVEACKKHDILLNYVSTCCVYGNTTQHPTTEDAPKNPTEIYGQTKLAGECILLGYHQLYGMPFNIVRPSTVYGEGMRPALAVYIFLTKAMKGEIIPIHGTGKQTRSFIYIDDLIDGMVKVLERSRNQVINLAGAQEISVIQLAHKCYEVCEREPNFEFVEDRKGQVMKEQISIEKAKNLFSWRPIVDFDIGLKKTLEWLNKKN